MTTKIRLGALSLMLLGGLLFGGCGRSAAWSPTGRSLVIDVGGELQLFDVPTGKFTNLETGERYAVNPTFSPDGKQLAYYGITRARAGGGSCDLWVRESGESSGSDRKIASDVAPLNGQLLPDVATRLRSQLALAWSPDSRQLAHSRIVNDWGAIEIADLASGAVTHLGRKGESQIMPVWAPVGARLAYFVETPGSRLAEPGLSYDLYVTGPGSGAPRQRVWDSRKEGDLWPYWPAVWSEYGQGVVVLKQEHAGPAFEAWLVPTAGGMKHLITRIDTPQATMTPALDAVVYMGGEHHESVIYKSAPFQKEQALDRIAPEGRKDPAPLEIPAVPLFPVLSADGKTVALPLVDGHRELRLYEVGTGRKRVYPIP